MQAGPTDLALVPLLYTLAATRSRRVSSAALAVCLLAAPLALLHWARHYQGPLSAAMIGVAGLAVTTWALGDSLAARRAYNAALEERAARLEAERDAQTQIAAAAERARELEVRRARVVDASDARLHRIERDLHDGAQVRLTALAMALGEIKESVDGDATATATAAWRPMSACVPSWPPLTLTPRRRSLSSAIWPEGSGPPCWIAVWSPRWRCSRRPARRG